MSTLRNLLGPVAQLFPEKNPNNNSNRWIYAVDAERCKFRRERRLVTKQQRVYRFLIHMKSLYYLLPSRPQFSHGSLSVCCDFILEHERLIEARTKPASRRLFSLLLILGFFAFCHSCGSCSQGLSNARFGKSKQKASQSWCFLFRSPFDAQNRPLCSLACMSRDINAGKERKYYSLS